MTWRFELVKEGGLVGAEGCGRAGDDLQLGELQSKQTRRGATTVDEERHLLLRRLIGPRQAEALIHALTDRRDADAQRGRLLVAQTVGDLDLHVALCDEILGKGAIFVVEGVDTVREAGDAVTLFEGLLDVGADLDDGAAVVAADGGAFAGG